MKIFISPEHPDITPVFGTACPPRGLSGVLRGIAYKFGEGRLAHWMTLMLADRIDVVEGLLDDAIHARFPNLVRERGWDVAMTHDRSGKGRTAERSAGIKIAAAVGVIGIIAAGAYMATRRRRAWEHLSEGAPPFVGAHRLLPLLYRGHSKTRLPYPASTQPHALQARRSSLARWTSPR
ncbi:MAG: hypothetical protein ACTHQM_06810 [Thermoanaerobaculia bacterium]